MLDNKEEFCTWLTSQKGLKEKSARDVFSRLQRVRKFSGSAKVSPSSYKKIESFCSTNDSSVFVRAQLRRSVALFLEFQESKK